MSPTTLVTESQTGPRTGVVRMDDFAGPATWDGGGSESMVIKFNVENMSAEDRAQLAGFRGHTLPVTMQFPGCTERPAMIVGFGSQHHAVYITWI